MPDLERIEQGRIAMARAHLYVLQATHGANLTRYYLAMIAFAATRSGRRFYCLRAARS